jgi:hypothetical protein
MQFQKDGEQNVLESCSHSRKTKFDELTRNDRRLSSSPGSIPNSSKEIMPLSTSGPICIKEESPSSEIYISNSFK